jgi:hypothetical protein
MRTVRCCRRFSVGCLATKADPVLPGHPCSGRQQQTVTGHRRSGGGPDASVVAGDGELHFLSGGGGETGLAVQALGQHHQTHGSQVFSALATNNGEGSPWIDDDHLIVTIVLYGNDFREYLDIGDRFALWLGDGTCRGIVTRRLFV